MSIKTTREIRADVNGESGRVRAWVAEREPARLSIAVPGDRAVLDARDTRALAKWLEERANEMEAEESSARQRVTAERTLGRTAPRPRPGESYRAWEARIGTHFA